MFVQKQSFVSRYVASVGLFFNRPSRLPFLSAVLFRSFTHTKDAACAYLAFRYIYCNSVFRLASIDVLPALLSLEHEKTS